MKTVKTFLLLFKLGRLCNKKWFYKNNLNAAFLKNKTVVFSFDENSKQSVGYSGPRAGIERQTDVKKCSRSIEELAKETKLDLKLKENSTSTNSSENKCECSCNWHFMEIQLIVRYYEYCNQLYIDGKK
jgi:hypothetical protein